ncbi:MAG: hypothetical protein U0527_12015 [Candidatus Eisenbacteria bacterium]
MAEDRRRGWSYLPEESARRHGTSILDLESPAARGPMLRAIRRSGAGSGVLPRSGDRVHPAAAAHRPARAALLPLADLLRPPHPGAHLRGGAGAAREGPHHPKRGARHDQRDVASVPLRSRPWLALPTRACRLTRRMELHPV